MYPFKCLLSNLRQTQRKVVTVQRVISMKQYVNRPRQFSTQEDDELG